jgi:hypothetical protein
VVAARLVADDLLAEPVVDHREAAHAALVEVEIDQALVLAVAAELDAGVVVRRLLGEQLEQAVEDAARRPEEHHAAIVVLDVGNAVVGLACVALAEVVAADVGEGELLGAVAAARDRGT